jgi:hypothetical protein
MRRLSHPNIIAIKDVFVRPSATGVCGLGWRGGIHLFVGVVAAAMSVCILAANWGRC